MSNIDDNSRSSPKDKYASRHHDGSAQESKDKSPKGGHGLSNF
jgi:hypothetical protein